jgi:predicted glutamine amidotransferase
MCRWHAHFGQPIAIDELLYRTEHDLIYESLRARVGVETTNGDGFGPGWYRDADGDVGRPGRYRSVTPAWSGTNLRDLMSHIESPLFPAHVRDAVAGSTDSEVLSYLASTFGLERDPVGAVERAVGFVEATGRGHGVANPVHMTLGVSDGRRL